MLNPDGQSKIGSMFGIPVMKIEGGLHLLHEDIKYIENLPTQGKVRDHNAVISRNVFLLDHDKRLQVVKERLNKAANEYIDRVLCVDNEFEMTNSWTARTNNEHPRHDHKNTIVSVVYYVKADKATITFYNNHNWLSSAFNFDLSYKQFNIHNSTNLDYDVKTGDIMIFPGHISHSATNHSDTTKTIIGANYFIRGKVGNDYNTTSLDI